nr:MAG TPA_asm: hypothetical protein [Caudoviricetes sp.]
MPPASALSAPPNPPPPGSGCPSKGAGSRTEPTRLVHAGDAARAGPSR